MKIPVPLLVLVYLAAIVAANVSLAQWGPQMAIWNAAALIGLDLSTRDRLHDVWHGNLRRNMAALIVTGSVLSYIAGEIVPRVIGDAPLDNVGRIALASCVAFGAAATADALVYHVLRDRDWHHRANVSNIAGAAVDSAVFLALWPFGFNLTFAFSLFSAKVAGGLIWSFVLRRSPGAEWEERNSRLWGASARPSS